MILMPVPICRVDSIVASTHMYTHIYTHYIYCTEVDARDIVVKMQHVKHSEIQVIRALKYTTYILVCVRQCTCSSTSSAFVLQCLS